MAAAAAAVVAAPGPAAADHQGVLQVTVGLSAAGPDGVDLLGVEEREAEVVQGVVAALALPDGSWRSSSAPGSGVSLEPDLPLAVLQPDGRFRYDVDTGALQLLAQRHGYDEVVLQVCAPRVSQRVEALVAPGSGHSGLRRCHGWRLAADDQPVRARLVLAPGAGRFPAAVWRTIGVAAVAFGLLGAGASWLRQGPLRRRTWASWLLAGTSTVVVGGAGWLVTTVVLLVRDVGADAVLLGGGGVAEHVARTTLPGLLFLVPALLPAVVLLRAPAPEAAPARHRDPGRRARRRVGAPAAGVGRRRRRAGPARRGVVARLALGRLGLRAGRRRPAGPGGRGGGDAWLSRRPGPRRRRGGWWCPPRGGPRRAGTPPTAGGWPPSAAASAPSSSTSPCGWSPRSPSWASASSSWWPPPAPPVTRAAGPSSPSSPPTPRPSA